MAGKLEANDKQNGGKAADASHALLNDSYNPPLNHRVMNGDGTIKNNSCPAGPKLNDLQIDEAHVKIYDTPRRDASYAERQAAAKREMPVSDQHFRELVKSGAEFMAINSGNFNLAMKNALSSAHQSDKADPSHKHNYVDNMLKFVNADLCNTSYTLRRQGNNIQVFDTHWDNKKPQGTYNLDKKDWVR